MFEGRASRLSCCPGPRGRLRHRSGWNLSTRLSYTSTSMPRPPYLLALSLLSQLKQQNKTENFSPTVDNESISSDIAEREWCSNGQQRNRDVSSSQLHDADCLQSVLQNFSLANTEESERNRYPDTMLVSPTFYSTEGPNTTFFPPNITQVQEDCISSSWEMPQGGPLGEILSDSKSNEDLAKNYETKSYGWLLNLDHAT